MTHFGWKLALANDDTTSVQLSTLEAKMIDYAADPQIDINRRNCMYSILTNKENTNIFSFNKEVVAFSGYCMQLPTVDWYGTISDIANMAEVLKCYMQYVEIPDDENNPIYRYGNAYNEGELWIACVRTFGDINFVAPTIPLATSINTIPDPIKVPQKCTCDLHQIMRSGHSPDCPEKKK